jgi:ABC-2 type transport system permease protein
MKKAWVLSKLYINSLYGINNFIHDIKSNKKAALKTVGLIVLIVLSLSGTVGMFIGLNIKLFDALKKVNQQGIIITMSVITSSIITLVFGMIGIVATYFVEKEGDLILSMPIKAWQILVAKFASNYVYEAILSTVIMATGFMVYGIKSGSSPFYYIICIIVSFAVPLIPMTIGYLVVIPLMRAGSILRKKDFTMIMSGVMAMIFAFGIQYLSQIMIKVESNPAEIISKLSSKDGLVSFAGKIYFPSIWATYGITDYTSIKGIVNLIIFAGISILVVGLLITLMSGVYATSIEGSQEVTKRKKFTSNEFKQNLKRKSKFSALLAREIKMMNREPVYFLNGPLIIFIMPAILGFAFFMQKSDLSKELEKITTLNNSQFYTTLMVAAFSVFLGVTVNITSTCISREGKAFEVIKALPIETKEYLNAKLAHGLLFGIIASLMCSVLGWYIFKMEFANILLAFMIGMLVMLPILISGIILELSWPKLIWDNPQKAMKQNLNGMIIVLGIMFVLPLLGFLIFKFVSNPLLGYVILTLFPVALSIVLYKALLDYGEKRFLDIEI